MSKDTKSTIVMYFIAALAAYITLKIIGV